MYLIIATAISFYLYGISSYKGNFDNITKETNEYKIRVIGSNISLDEIPTLDIDPVSVIKELIKLSKPNDNEKIIFVWPEGILQKFHRRN